MDDAILKSRFNGFVMVNHINENIEAFLINVNIMACLTTLSTVDYLAIVSITGFLTISNTKEFLTILNITEHPITKNIKASLIFADEEVIHNLDIILEFKIKSNQKILALIHTIIVYQYQIILRNF